MGAHAVARDAAGGVGGIKEGRHEWLGQVPGRRSPAPRRLQRCEANVEVRQTQPGTIQADNPFLPTAWFDASGNVFQAPHRGPARRLEFTRHVTMAPLYVASIRLR